MIGGGCCEVEVRPMGTFVAKAWVGHPIEDVFGWHERPGALRRLMPPWEPMRVEQEATGLAEGSEAVLRLTGPALLAPRLVSRHVRYRPPDEFADTLVSGPFTRWEHRHRFTATPDGGTTLTDEISYELPFGRAGALAEPLVRARLRRMFSYRQRVLAGDLDAHARAQAAPLTVAVTGASGLIGGALAAFLTTGGHRVVRLVRRPPRVPDEVVWDPADGTLDPAALEGVDAVVHLAGTPLFGRWTKARQHAMRHSRIAGTRLLARTLAELAPGGAGPRVLVSGSAIGWYGAYHGDEILTEESEPGDDFLARLCREWEAATVPASEAGVRVVRVRTGIAQSPAGGQLRLQLPQFLVGLGGRLGSGQQWVSWVSLDDIVGILHHALTTDAVAGPLNGSAPEPVTNVDYTRILGRVLRRPTLLPTPSLGPRLLLGEQGAREAALASQRVVPAVAERTGYVFRHPDLESALRHVLGRVD
jgi:uncharacterized protein (TIGR01777 family)